MRSLDRHICEQFANPTGLVGRVLFAIMNRQNRPLYEATLALLPAGCGPVLDVGCGNGHVMGLLAASHGDVLVGVDPSEDVIAIAARRHRKMVADGRMVFARGSADATGQPDGAFDAAYSVNTVYFWPDAEAGFTEIRRVLRADGVFLNALYTSDTLARFAHTAHGYRRYEPGELVAAAQAAGLLADSVSLLGGRAFCVRCYRR